MIQDGHKRLVLILTFFFLLIFPFLGEGFLKTENNSPVSMTSDKESNPDNIASKILARHPGTKALALAVPAFFREQMSRERNAAGSHVCTIGDYARFLKAVIAGDGLSEKIHSEMLHPYVKMTAGALFGPQADEPGRWVEGGEPYWCLGWIYFRSLLGESYFHVGAEEGFENFAVFFPKRQAGLVVFASGPSPSGAAGDAVKIFFGDTGIPFAWMGYQAP
ncbi:MAG: serine hydrolase [Candidatus Aminicenantes bacterium]|nr:serine hydrolase [Candidatus Aminicenantes bacterium]